MSVTEILQYSGLFVAIFVIYFFGVLSGGVGLAVRPILILMGLPAPVAIGSARVAHLGTRIIGYAEIRKSFQINIKKIFWLAIPSILGGLVGAHVTAGLDEKFLERLIGAFSIGMALFMFKSGHGLDVGNHVITPLRKALGFAGILVSGILGSITGGAGVFTSYILISLFNETYTSSAGIRKIIEYGGVLSSSTYFFANGLVNWRFVVIIFISGGLGSFFGVRHGIKKGESWVKTVTLVITVVIGVALLIGS
jgi:uncharacterized protein